MISDRTTQAARSRASARLLTDGAELIDANFAGVGAVEIDLGHVRSPSQSEFCVSEIAAADSAGYSGRFPTGNYGHVPQRDGKPSGTNRAFRDSHHADSVNVRLTMLAQACRHGIAAEPDTSRQLQERPVA